MKLGEFLRQGGRLFTPRPVSFKALTENANAQQEIVEVTARLSPVDEARRERVNVELLEDLRKRYPGKEIPDNVRENERSYRMLYESLVESTPNEAGGYGRLCETLTELRAVLTVAEAARLSTEYAILMADEFPEQLDETSFAELVEDAKKNSASSLLTKYGYDRTAQALRSLAARSG